MMPPLPPVGAESQSSGAPMPPLQRPEVVPAKMVDASPAHPGGPVLPPLPEVEDRPPHPLAPKPNGAATEEAEPKQEDAPRPLPLSKEEKKDYDDDLPFAMPDLSNIDQDIATAIQTAMMSSKKR